MDVTGPALRSIYTALNTAFIARLASTTALYRRVAMVVPSITSANEYPRFDDIPGLREWIGDRVVHDLSAGSYTLRNKTFESTFSIGREKIEDDQIGLFTVAAEQLGQSAGEFPDVLTFNLLKKGETELCYDGQYFFDTDHPGYDAAGAVTSVSNFQAGAGAAWYLMDDTKVIKPMVYQTRRPFVLTRKDDPQRDDNVFERNEFVYGTDGRCNVGFGLWQLVYKSKAALTAANYAAARAAMGTIRRRDGSVISINPRTLLVPPSLEADARQITDAATGAAGASNVWKGTAETLVVPHLA